jgi:carbonic anhydrase
MKARRGFDQTLAWISSVVFASCIFTALYFVSKHMAQHDVSQSDEEMADSDHDDKGHHEKSEHTKEKSMEDHADQEHHADPEEHADHGKSADHADAASDHDEHDEAHSKKKVHQPISDTAEHGEPSPKALAAKSLRGQGPEWGYIGAQGPEHWGQLDEEHIACGVGKFQSPVDLGKSFKTKQLHPIEFHYQATDGTISNEGHGIELDFGGGSYVMIEDERFDLVQTQFRAPSEHKIEGIPFDMEVQLIHKNKKGKVAIIAALVEEAQTKNAGIAPLWQKLPRKDDKFIVSSFHPKGLIPAKRDYFHYEGSLTTPPCTEGIKWYVMEETLRFSARQIDDYIGLVKFNARPVQPLYSRKVEKNW